MLEGVVCHKKIESICISKKDREIRRQKVLLNPSVVLYFGSYESSNLLTKSVRNFKLVLSGPCTERRQSKSNIAFGDSYLYYLRPLQHQYFQRDWIALPDMYRFQVIDYLFLFLNQQCSNSSCNITVVSVPALDFSSECSLARKFRALVYYLWF